MKTYSKLVLGSVVVCMLAVAVVQADPITIQRNQIIEIGMNRHQDNTVEIFFRSGNKIYYLPSYENDADAVRKGAEVVRLLKVCKRVIAQEYSSLSQDSSNVIIRRYTLIF